MSPIPWPLTFAPIDQRLATLTNDTHRAARLGVTPRTLNRYRHDGLSAPTADRLATRLGYHPHQLWGRLQYQLAEDIHHQLAHQTRGRYRTPHPHVDWEPHNQFCGRPAHAPAGRPHTCAPECPCTHLENAA